MADNVTLNPGSAGATIAADEIGGVQHQRVKVQHGADGAATDVSAASPLPAVVTNAGTFAVQVDGAALTALQLIDDAIYVDDADWSDGASKHLLVGGLYQSSPQTITDGDVGPIQVDENGNVRTVVATALPAGTNAIGKLAPNSGVDIGDVGLSGARTSGGTTFYRNVDVDETEDAVKASAGQVYWVHAMNLSNAVLYLHFYNAGTGSVTVGTTTPDLTFALATQGDTNGAGFTLSVPNGIAFGTAITIAATTTIGGSTGPGANEVIVNLGYA